MFLTNNSPDLCVLTLCIKFSQSNLYLASLPRISANLNENYRGYNFQALANISGIFPEILISGKITTLDGSTIDQSLDLLQRLHSYPTVT